MHSNDMVAVTSKLFPICCHEANAMTDSGGAEGGVTDHCVHTLTRKYPRQQSPRAPPPPQKKQAQPQPVPPKSGLSRMSYPFSNLSTVVLATDIPELPVEELRGRNHKSERTNNHTSSFFFFLTFRTWMEHLERFTSTWRGVRMR